MCCVKRNFKTSDTKNSTQANFIFHPWKSFSFWHFIFDKSFSLSFSLSSNFIFMVTNPFENSLNHDKHWQHISHRRLLAKIRNEKKKKDISNCLNVNQNYKISIVFLTFWSDLFLPIFFFYNFSVCNYYKISHFASGVKWMEHFIIKSIQSVNLFIEF